MGCAPHELILPSDSALSDMSNDVYHAFDIIFSFLFGFQLTYFRGKERQKKTIAISQYLQNRYGVLVVKVWSAFLSILYYDDVNLDSEEGIKKGYIICCIFQQC